MASKPEPPPAPDASRQRYVIYDDEYAAFVYTDEENIQLIWDPSQKFREDLIERQQSAYAAPPPSVSKKRKASPPPSSSSTDPSLKQSQRPTTSIYISNLPLDVTEDEIRDRFSRYGLILDDYKTHRPKIKLYRTPTGALKGDALVTYVKKESVDLAVMVLDETEFRDGNVIRVQPAVFDKKEKEEGNSNGDKKEEKGDKKRKLSKAERKQLERYKKKLEKQLDWQEDGDIDDKMLQKFQRTVILKNMFTLEEMEKDPGLLLDLKEDIQSACEELGDVTTVTVFDKHPEGVVSVRFSDKASADACVLRMHGRFYDRRQVVASIYDGVTKYNQYTSARESIEEQEQRLANYAKWLEGKEGDQAERDGDQTASENESLSDSDSEPEVEPSDVNALDVSKLRAPVKTVPEEERLEEDYFEGGDDDDA